MNRSTLPPAQRRTILTSHGYAWFALLGFVIFIALTVYVHMLRPGLDPLRRTLSEYAIGSPYGFLFSLALLCLGAGSFALWNGLRLSLTRSLWTRVGLPLLILWSIGTFVAAIFPTDANGVPVTVYGINHGGSASLAFLSVVFAALCLSVHFRRDVNWHSASAPALILTVMTFLLLGFFGLPDSLRGGGEKVFVGVVVGWLCFVGWRLSRLA